MRSRKGRKILRSCRGPHTQSHLCESEAASFWLCQLVYRIYLGNLILSTGYTVLDSGLRTSVVADMG